MRVQSPFRGELMMYDFAHDRLDRSLSCSVCLRSERFSYVVTSLSLASHRELYGESLRSSHERGAATASHATIESDGNRHRSVIDQCQSTPDGFSVLVSPRSQSEALPPPSLRIRRFSDAAWRQYEQTRGVAAQTLTLRSADGRSRA